MFTYEAIVRNARFAGQVVRYHGWPITRQQSVGEHTWQMMRIYWTIFGPLPPVVSTMVLWHDAGELAVGDPPHQAKAFNPDFKAIYDRLETAAVLDMGGPGELEMDSKLRMRVKACDLIELYEKARVEEVQGNRLAEPVSARALVALDIVYAKMFPPDLPMVKTYLKSFDEWCRS